MLLRQNTRKTLVQAHDALTEQAGAACQHAACHAWLNQTSWAYPHAIAELELCGTHARAGMPRADAARLDLQALGDDG